MAAMILRCKQVNATLGTSLAPWELMEMPEEWLMGIEMMIDDYPRAREWQKQVEASLARLRKSTRSQ